VFFVALEGLEGSGKSKQIELVSARIREAGYSVATVPEFSESLLGDYLFERLDEDRFLRAPGRTSAVTQLLAVAADTAYALEYFAADFDLVLKDRYRESIVACQHVALVAEYGYSIADALKICQFVASAIPDPADEVLWLDCDIETRVDRLRARGDFQEGDEEYFERRAVGYTWMKDPNSGWNWRAIQIDAGREMEVVSDEIVRLLLEKLK
jgi:thymidylate kinase